MTLEELITQYRLKLDDVASPYNWSDEEITGFINDTVDILCEKCFLLEETGIESGAIPITFTAATKKITRATGSFLQNGFMEDDIIHTTSAANAGPFTIASVSALEIVISEALVNGSETVSVATAISTIFLKDGIPVYASDNRIVRIQEAYIDPEQDPLVILRETAIPYMNYNHRGWRVADKADPQCLLTRGFGSNKVRPWPTPKADDTLLMTIFRRPRTRLDFTDQAKSPEIPDELHKHMLNYVLHLAYSKHDAETEDLLRAQKHLALFEQQDIPAIRRLQGMKDYAEMTNVPMAANL